MSTEDLIRPHLWQTAARIAGHPCVLVVQDTTGLNYGQRAGLGLVGTSANGAKGIWLHSSMAFTPTGQSLGLVQVEPWQRDPREFGKAQTRRQRAIEDKESQRWINSFAACVELAEKVPGTQLINVADREGDIYELFRCAADHPEVGVLVRARHDRRTKEGPRFQELLQAGARAGFLEVKVPRGPGKKARTALLEVRYERVSVCRPRTKQDAVDLWVVEARETGNPAGSIHWVLVTNLEVTQASDAQNCIRMYAVRWQIEEYHRVLKSGCQTEDRQLETAEALLKVLMLDMVVAWRVLELNRLARSSPDTPAAEQFSAQELQLLRAVKGEAAARVLTLREAVRAVAQLGGFLARASDGEPGAMTLWRGLEVLASMLAGWQLAKSSG